MKHFIKAPPPGLFPLGNFLGLKICRIIFPCFWFFRATFKEQYTEQWHALDKIAERIRDLGFMTPGSQGEYARLSSLDDGPELEGASDWRALVKTLLQDNEGICVTASAALDKAAQIGDEPTADLMAQRLQIHQKYAWILRSLLQG